MTPLQLFALVFLTVFIAEMGDKTQLLLVAMAGKYPVRQILAGTWLATLLLNVLAVAVGAALSQWLDLRFVKAAAALAFFYFAWSSLRGEDENEEAQTKSVRFGPVAAIFLTFFLGELGDKTQLSAVTLAAAYPDGTLTAAAVICLGCTVGLIAADALGLLAGLLLKNNLPTHFLRYLTFAVFALFGVLQAQQALFLLLPDHTTLAWILLFAVVLIFGALCMLTTNRRKSE